MGTRAFACCRGGSLTELLQGEFSQALGVTGRCLAMPSKTETKTAQPFQNVPSYSHSVTAAVLVNVFSAHPVPCRTLVSHLSPEKRRNPPSFSYRSCSPSSLTAWPQHWGRALSPGFTGRFLKACVPRHRAPVSAAGMAVVVALIPPRFPHVSPCVVSTFCRELSVTRLSQR